MLSLLLTVLAPPTPADQAFTAYLADGDHNALVSTLDGVLDEAMAAVDPDVLADPKQAKKAFKSIEEYSRALRNIEESGFPSTGRAFSQELSIMGTAFS